MTGGSVAVLLWLAAWVLHRSPSHRIRLPANSPEDSDRERWRGLEDPALMMDLTASMLAAGSSLDYCLDVLSRSASPPVSAALTAVKTALDLGAPWDVAWTAVTQQAEGGVVQELGRALRFAGTTGAPSAAVVTAHAAQYRRRRNREAEKRAAALGVRLVVPLGLCSLPAFICLGVIPVLVGLFPAFT